LHITQVRWKSGGRILSLALLSGMTLAPTGGHAQSVATVQTPVSRSWLSLDSLGLCRHWVTFTPSGTSVAAPSDSMTAALMREQTSVSTNQISGVTMSQTTHCTTKWHVDQSGRLISDAPEWVSDPTGAWPTTSTADGPRRLKYSTTITRTLSAKIVVKVQPVYKPKPAITTSRVTYAAPSAPASGSTGQSAYAMSDFAGDPYSQYFGVCTWYAWYRHQNEPLMRLGNALSWSANAPAFGLRTGTIPAVGATAVFQPGVEGAGSGGHVAHVEAILSNGQFLVSEMNFYDNGGGWGRVDWRVVTMEPGITFVY